MFGRLSNVYNSVYNTLKKKTRSWATRLIKNHLDVRESRSLAHGVPNTYSVIYYMDISFPSRGSTPRFGNHELPT